MRLAAAQFKKAGKRVGDPRDSCIGFGACSVCTARCVLDQYSIHGRTTNTERRRDGGRPRCHAYDVQAQLSRSSTPAAYRWTGPRARRASRAAERR
jgi:hypothetical protein